ncbi:hypothetical protein [Microseira wollei]|uniref:hypothetical protein n=1 Tax=Microseira wollei TaxID=467598 RepID=UPI001CFE3EBB|nr:hypothetical protein [Microseira wollei]
MQDLGAYSGFLSNIVATELESDAETRFHTMSGRLPMIGSREHHRYFAGTDNFKVSRAPTQRCGSVYGQFNGHDIISNPVASE